MLEDLSQPMHLLVIFIVALFVFGRPFVVFRIVLGCAFANKGTSVGPANPIFTPIREELNTTGGWVTTRQSSYFDTGTPYQSTDLKQNLTTYSYDPAFYGAYLTQTQLPTTYGSITHIVKGAYYFNTGKLTTFTEQKAPLAYR